MRWLVSMYLGVASKGSSDAALRIVIDEMRFWLVGSFIMQSRSVGVRTARVGPQWALQGTNDNQLIIFLLANVCVGAVNISIRTLLQPAVVVWLLMTSYMLLLFICAHRLGVAEKRIRIL